MSATYPVAPLRAMQLAIGQVMRSSEGVVGRTPPHDDADASVEPTA
jgi:hypothetical protein